MKKMCGLPVLWLSLCITLTIFESAAIAQIPNVLSAFNAVNENSAQRFEIARPRDFRMPQGTRAGDYHQQSIQKLTRGGFAVSGSSPGAGYLYFTNPANKIVKVVTSFEGQFNHLGGFQVTDDVLAVGFERLQNGMEGSSRILFFDTRDPSQPRRLVHLTIQRNERNSTAGAVGLCRNGNRWLLLVGNWDSKRLDFYHSTSDDLRAASTSFNLVGRWSKATDGLGSEIRDTNWGKYQNINLFRQSDGTLFFIGMHTDVLDGMADWADLYRVSIARNVSVTKVGKAHFRRNGNGPRFLYGSSFHWNATTRRFEVFACEGNLSGQASTINRCNVWR